MTARSIPSTDTSVSSTASSSTPGSAPLHSSVPDLVERGRVEVRLGRRAIHELEAVDLDRLPGRQPQLLVAMAQPVALDLADRALDPAAAPRRPAVGIEPHRQRLARKLHDGPGLAVPDLELCHALKSKVF